MTDRRWIIAIVIGGALLRFVPIWFGLPYAHARPDETTALGLARDVRAGDLNPHFFHWPSLTIYVFAAIQAALSALRRLLGLDPTLGFNELVMSARAAVALAGTLTIVAIYRLAARMAGPATGAIAALFLAIAVLHVRDSHFAMTDVLMTLLLTVSLTLLLHAIDIDGNAGMTDAHRRPLILFALSGLMAGLATSTRYNAAALVAAMAAAQLLYLRLGRRFAAPAAWLPSVLFAAAFAAGFFSGTPYALLDRVTFMADVRFDMTHLAGGHGLDLGRGWLYHVKRTLPLGLGLPVFAAAIVGIFVMARRYPQQSFVLGAFGAAFYGSIGSGRTVFFRYVLPLVPLLCVSAAVAVESIAAWISARARLRMSIATAVLAAIVAAAPLVNSVWFDYILAQTDTRVVAAEWLVPRLVPSDTLYDGGGSYAELNLSPATFHRWTYNRAAESFEHAGALAPDWLILHESPLMVYSPTPGYLLGLARSRYDLVQMVTGAISRADPDLYDLQDAFFLPLAGFSTVRRPGPTIRIYRRKDAPPMPTTDDKIQGLRP